MQDAHDYPLVWHLSLPGRACTAAKSSSEVQSPT